MKNGKPSNLFFLKLYDIPGEPPTAYDYFAPRIISLKTAGLFERASGSSNLPQLMNTGGISSSPLTKEDCLGAIYLARRALLNTYQLSSVDVSCSSIKSPTWAKVYNARSQMENGNDASFAPSRKFAWLVRLAVKSIRSS
jgi:hypothetical protein